MKLLLIALAFLAGCTSIPITPGPTPSDSPTPTPSGIPPILIGKKSTVYFGRLIRFQGAKELTGAIAKMAAYDLVIFPGDAVLTGPAGWQHGEATQIIAGLKGKTLVAGYVPLGTAEGKGNVGEDGKLHKRITREQFTTQVATWKAMGADIVFADMAGDQDVYQVTEADQVFAITQAHLQGMPIILNNWKVTEIYRPGKDLPLWPGRDFTMFEDLGADTNRDATKLSQWKSANVKNVLVIGVGFESNKNSSTDALGKELNFFGYAADNYGG